MPRSRELQLRFGGLHLYAPSDQPFTYFATLFLDVYGWRLLRSGDTVIDVGAGWGDFSVIAARMVGRRGLVVAVEPSRASFALLRRNIRANGLQNVIAIRASLAGSSGYPKSALKEALVHPPLPDTEALGPAPNVTLDDLIEILQLPRVDFLKIDIEGSESEALREPRMLDKVRSLSVELHGTEITGKVQRILSDAGFSHRNLDLGGVARGAIRNLLLHPGCFFEAEVKTNGFSSVSLLSVIRGARPMPALNQKSGIVITHAARPVSGTGASDAGRSPSLGRSTV
jgi:FkbM family methyltransferase